MLNLLQLLRLYGWLCLFLLLTLCQCSGPAPKSFRIGFSQCTMGDRWRLTMVEEMKRELSFYPNVSFNLKDARGNNQTQIVQINQLLTEGIDLLIVSPNEAEPVTPVIEQAYQKGIPVVLVDRQILSKKYTAFVGVGNTLVGHNAGLAANIILGGRGQVIEVGEGARTTPSIGRHQGFIETIGKMPGIQLKASMVYDWKPNSLESTLTGYLRQNPDIDLIFAHNDRLAYRIYQLLRQQHLEKQIRIIGVDGLSGTGEGLELVDKGILAATILYPTGGEEAVNIALKILHKQPYRKENQLFTTIINRDNVRIMRQQAAKVSQQEAAINRQANRIQDLARTYSSQRNILYLTLGLLTLVVIFGAVLLLLLREKQLSNRVLAEQNREIKEQKEEIERVSAQARQATEEKLRFYSYISHEFNTPLSLLLTPTEDLLGRKHLDVREARNGLILIQKNAYRLLRLVDQILDLRRADAGKLQLRAQQGDVVAFIRDIVQDFRVKAERQRIDLRLLTDLPQQSLWFDREKLDKVLFNLLSNAFKYTPKSGFIHVYLEKTDSAVLIRVRDNGQGMTATEQAHIFDLFYTNTSRFTLGNGLGLALSREFATLHHGELTVASQPGQGTTFTLLLPLGMAHLTPDEIGPVGALPVSFPVDVDTSPVTQADTGDFSPKKGTLLVIEDNDELREYLAARLGERYEVVAEGTAEAGWERILDTVPDLIISDIMLPGTDGVRLTERIREDLRTSTIPVILLTAKGQMEDRILGTRAGADAYITKPFQMAYMLETIQTILANRAKLQNRFAGDMLAKTANRQEKKFLNELTALIEQNLTDPSFGVEQLSREMGLSRVQLYRKAQSMLGKNVNEYFAEIRLRKAKALLVETQKPIAEIAYETGFNSPAYFTTFFKQHTQQTPSDFRKAGGVSA